MTTYEHAMLGIDGVLALGLHRRYGWQLAAVAGAALIQWGDPGLSLIFIAGMFAMLRWRSRVQGIAALTLLFVLVYIAVRGSGVA